MTARSAPRSILTSFPRSKHKKIQKERLFIKTRAHSMIINNRSFEPFCVWVLFYNASSHSVSDFPFFSKFTFLIETSGLLDFYLGCWTSGCCF